MSWRPLYRVMVELAELNPRPQTFLAQIYMFSELY